MASKKKTPLETGPYLSRQGRWPPAAPAGRDDREQLGAEPQRGRHLSLRAWPAPGGGCLFRADLVLPLPLGRKDKVRTTEGSYSLCRNPLYFCSGLGALGIGFCTETLANPLLFAAIFAVDHPGIIRREETRLQELFGEAYAEFRRSTPIFLPSLMGFQEPAQYQVNPLLFRRHPIDDTLLIFLAAVLEFVEGLRDAVLAPSLLHLW